MDKLCDRLMKTGGFSVADFVCPMLEAAAAFEAEAEIFIVFIERIARLTATMN